MAIDADRQDLDRFFLFFSQKALQLTELLCAVGSPTAPVENQHGILFSTEVGERNQLAIHVL